MSIGRIFRVAISSVLAAIPQTRITAWNPADTSSDRTLFFRGRSAIDYIVVGCGICMAERFWWFWKKLIIHSFMRKIIIFGVCKNMSCTRLILFLIWVSSQRKMAQTIAISKSFSPNGSKRMHTRTVKHLFSYFSFWKKLSSVHNSTLLLNSIEFYA